MRTYEKNIFIDGKAHTAEITFRKVKRLNMRVKGDRIYVSVPQGMSERRAEEFLSNNIEWLKKMFKKSAENRETVKKNTVTFLGKEYPLVIEEGKKCVKTVDGTFTVCAPDGDREKAKRIFIDYWKKEALGFFTEEVKKALLICGKKFGINFMPKVSVAKVSSYWGKCFWQKGEVRFNIYLLQADYEYCRYVVYHELAHFLHHNHGTAFYSALFSVLPDAKTQKGRGKYYNPRMWFDNKSDQA